MKRTCAVRVEDAAAVVEESDTRRASHAGHGGIRVAPAVDAALEGDNWGADDSRQTGTHGPLNTIHTNIWVLWLTASGVRLQGEVRHVHIRRHCVQRFQHERQIIRRRHPAQSMKQHHCQQGITGMCPAICRRLGSPEHPAHHARTVQQGARSPRANLNFDEAGGRGRSCRVEPASSQAKPPEPTQAQRCKNSSNTGTTNTPCLPSPRTRTQSGAGWT